MGVFHVFQIVPNHAKHHSHTIYLPIEKQLLPSCIKPTTLRNFASIVAGVQVLAAVSGLNNFFMATDWLKKQHFHKKIKKTWRLEVNLIYVVQTNHFQSHWTAAFIRWEISYSLLLIFPSYFSIQTRYSLNFIRYPSLFSLY